MLVNLLKGFLTFMGSGVVVVIIIYVLAELNKIDAATSFVFRLCRRVSRRFQRGVDATYIQGEINRTCGSLDYDSPGAIPYAPKIRWVGVNGVDKVQDNEVIICLRSDESAAESLVKATLQYLPLAMVREARPYMLRAQSLAMDLAVAREIVINNPESQRILMKDYVANASETNAAFDKWMGIFTRLINSGMFSRMFLPEIGRMGRFLGLNTPPTRELMQEAENVAYFVNSLARREEREEIPLDLFGRTVRTGAILFAKSAMLDTYGEAAHWWRLRRKIRMGLDTIYLIAWSQRAMDVADVIARRALNEKMISSYREKRFARRTLDGSHEEDMVLACSVGVHIEEMPVSLEDRLVDACEAALPELVDGIVEIVALSRVPSHISIVALRSLREGYDVRLIATRERSGLVSSELGNEPVRIIPWCDDPKELLTRVLSLRRYSGFSVLVDPDKKEALIGLPDLKAQIAVRGPEGSLLNAAEKLIVWRIYTTVSAS